MLSFRYVILPFLPVLLLKFHYVRGGLRPSSSAAMPA
jgi:hypothetical protein